jgi:curved DNA-binding protein CbpA
MDRRELERQVDAMIQRLDDADFYELLGVQRNANAESIKRAFHDRARVFHADNHPDLNTAFLQEKMQRIFSELSNAHTTLTDKAKREEYDAMLSLTERGVPTDLRVIFDADKLHQTGKRLLDRGLAAKALDHFTQAATANPSEAEYEAYRLWATFMVASEDSTRTVDVDRLVMNLARIAETERHLDAADEFLGNIARAQDRFGDAKRHYDAALKKNPDNIAAQSGLRFINMRQRKESTGSFSFVKRLFGKK